MEIKKLLKTMLNETSVFFTVVTALYALMMMIANTGDKEILLSAERLLLNFMFGWLASLAQALYRMKSIPRLGRSLLRYAVFAISFYLCFLLPAAMTASQILIGLVLFTLAYALVMGICTLFLSRFRANAVPQEEYQNQYRKTR